METTKGARVTYEDGTVILTSINPQCTDEEIKAYFAIGRSFNIGDGPNDYVQKVKSVEIL